MWLSPTPPRLTRSSRRCEPAVSRCTVLDPIVHDPAAPAGPAAPAPRWPRVAVTVVFVVHGLLFASWTAHIPQIKAHLGLTDATLGLALLGAPLGAVSAMMASA